MAKLIQLLVVSAILAYGAIIQNSTVLNFGAIVYLVTLVVGMFPIVKLAKRYKNNEEFNETTNSSGTSDKVANALELVIVWSGMLVMAFQVENFSTAGTILWIGGVLGYYFAGAIVKNITGLPLQFGYGGWVVRRRRR